MRTRLAVVLLAAVWSQASWADVPATLGYSGRLLRTDGGAEVGVAHLTFSIFDVPSGGVALWSEQQALLLSNEGLYSTQLGAVKPLPERLFDAPGSRFLEIAVGDTVLTPRQAIGSVAYALTTRSLKGGTVDATALKVNGADLVLAGKIASGFLNPGPGLEIDATRNALGLRACAAGQVLIWDGPAATWKCGTAAGPAGQSVVASVEPSGVQCATGGLKLVSASGTSYLCNGAPGTSATRPIGAGLA